MRKITQILAFAVGVSLLGPASVTIRAQEHSPKQDVKDAGHDTKDAAKDTAGRQEAPPVTP
jgi:hypothetical protein